MIGFVERLPDEWESKWTSMLMRSSHDLKSEEGKETDVSTNLLLILLKDSGTPKLEQKFAGLVPNPHLTLYFM